MANRKIIATAETWAEAEAIQSALAASGIEALVDNGTLSTILPHQTLAFGGVTVSVWEQDAEAALQLLNSAQAEYSAAVDTAPPISDSEDHIPDATRKAFRECYKRAVGAGILGSLLLPIFMNLYSFYQLKKAYQISPELFKARRGVVLMTVLFNVVFIGVGVIMYPILMFE
jgi:hypothetical protein